MGKKALVIGIYYKGRDGLQAGDDAIIVATHLQNREYTDLLLMLDKNTDDWESYGIETFLHEDFSGDKVLPKRNNIIKAMKWLVKDAEDGDELFLFFAGHGAQTEDKDGDEDDGLDEYILTMDDKKLTDDKMHDILIKDLPEGVRLTAVFDCCSSGTILDLRYLEKDGKLRKNTSKHGTKARVVLFSGCKDNETGADSEVDDSGTYQDLGMLGAGLFTHALAEHHLAGDVTAPTHNELLNTIREYVLQKEEESEDTEHQSVQMSSSVKFDLDEEEFRI